MATDLNLVHDHPVALLRKAAVETHDRTNSMSASVAFEHAALTLQRHEQDNGVIFTALDKDALARVAEAYDNLHPQIEPRDTLHATEEFASAVRDLLGLDD